MSEILSQEEVDSLLSGLSEGKIATEQEAAPEPEGISKYDFISQERVIRGRMPTFEVINERFAREVRASLSELLHTNVDITVESLDTLKFSEFGRSLPVPTSLHVFRMDPLRGHALLVLESQLVFNLIDTLFGGKGTGKAKIEGREFTSIEDVMIQKVVKAVLKNVETAWAPVEPVAAILVRSEVNPQFASIVLPTDSVIVVKYEVELDQAAGTIIMCLPYSMLEPMRSKLAAGFQSDALEIDHTWQRRVKEIISDSEVVFSVQLGNTEISGKRLINLRIGDVIQLDQDADEPLFGLIEKVPKFKGSAGLQKGIQSFKINEKILTEWD
ncbi:MAG: flagellar motor switch protein FliM [Desulfobacterales bacterium]|nr:flagellar motor switch protein FliM [Desulfobacterales bacterium]